ncbi:MAG: eL32 family ribosomal protein [Candidatus Pacearchaeota archaeon]
MLKRRKPTFLRKDSFKKSKLGKRRKKKQKWRRPRGRHSKLREKRTGHMIQPSIGWGSPRDIKGLVRELKPKLIYNLQDLENVKGDEIGVIGKIGKRKKIEIIEKASVKNIKLLNVNVPRFIEKIKAEREEKLKRKIEEQSKILKKGEKSKEEIKSKEKEVKTKEEKK